MTREQRFLRPATIPDGKYEGRWSGYHLEFEHDGETCEVETITKGVRGLNIPVTFRVANGKLDETSITDKPRRVQ